MRYRFLNVAAFMAVAVAGMVAVSRPALSRQALHVMYVSDARTAAVNVFRMRDGRQVGAIPYPMATGGIKLVTGVGIATDSASDLWAGFEFDDGRNFPGKIVLYGFAPGHAHWFTTIAGGCCGSPNLAVSSRGEIAEALGYFPPDYGGGVAFVEPGRRFVGRVNLALLGAVYAAYDAKGTLWVGGVDAGFREHFGLIRHGSNTFEEVGLRPAARLGPMAVDRGNDVVVVNDGIAYAYDDRGALVYRTALRAAAQVVAIALTPDGSALYVAQQNGIVRAYAFPRGGAPFATYRVGGTPYAIALGAI